MDDENLVVAGYQFLTKEDAEKARLDIRKIEYLKSQVNPSSAEGLKAVYEKAIQNRIFATPVGLAYLADLKRRMAELGVDCRYLTPVPMTVSFTHTPLPDDYVPRQRIQRAPQKKKAPWVLILTTLNIVLVILIVVMFLILNSGTSDNILNYKRNITNRYASWEQDLKQREQVIRDWEREHPGEVETVGQTENSGS